MLHVLNAPQTVGDSAGMEAAGFRHDSAARRVLETVAKARGLRIGALCGSGRSAEVALGRHIAMYLMHVELGRKYAEVGRMFGRDRTTVSHACALVEDLREDARFDTEIEALEAQIRAGAKERSDGRH